MATIVALLHHKMPHFFWTGFYRLHAEVLVAGPYQGPLACAVLRPAAGVCWAAVTRGETLLGPDVETFPGHVACDARSKSEVVVLLRNRAGEITGLLDVDSDQPAAFSQVDVKGLEQIVAMLYLPAEAITEARG